MSVLVDYALQFVGLPYRWGGDDTIDGFDCSGFVQELLASVGMDPRGDQTSDALYRHFLLQPHSNALKPGSLAFFGSQSRITHVAMMINHWQMIEAAGGGSRTKTRSDAASQNAYIRIRPLNLRRDLVAVLHPNYSF
jgi:cell wall-associated NlpC family hydrolase